MINLIINPDSIRISKSKISTQVFSEIYFQLDYDTFFPAEHWDDFSLIILGWWLKEGLSISFTGEAEFRFMDGPYYLKVSIIDEMYKIIFINERYGFKQVVLSKLVKPKDFLQNLASSANLFLRNLPTKAKKINDVLKLESDLKQLQKKLKEFS